MMRLLNVFRKILVIPVTRSLDRPWVIIQSEGIVPRNTPPLTRSFFSTEVLLQPGDEQQQQQQQLSKRKLKNIEVTKTLLRDFGFTDTQLSRVYTKHPNLFTSVPERTLLPKLEFFRSIGFSNADLAHAFSLDPLMLRRNLQNKIIPGYNFLKSLLISDEKVVFLLKRDLRVLNFNIEKDVAPNVAALRKAGVPQSRVVFLMLQAPKVLFDSSERLTASMNKATEMGFSPTKLSFIRALQVFSLMPKSTWDRKMEVLSRCGFSDAQVLLAFRSCPLFLYTGDQKIVRIMDFLVKKMGWQPLDVAQCPTVFSYCFDKKIVPRCTVVKALQAKRLVRDNISLNTILSTREDVFLVRFIKKYEDDFPGLMDLYLGKKGRQEPKT